MKVEVLREKYQDLSIPVKATIWFAICQFLQKGISVIITPIYTRLLSTYEYGRISTFTSWDSILSILTGLSTYKGMMNCFVKFKSIDKSISTIISLNIIISCFWSFIFALFHKPLANFTGLSFSLLICLLIYSISENVITCWTVGAQYEYRYKEIVAITFSYTLISALIGIFAVIFISKTAESKIIAQIFAMLIADVIILIKTYKKGHSFYIKEQWIYLLGFCIPLIPHYFSETILQSSDRIMINNMCGSSQTAIYSIAYSIGSLINMITSAINSAFAPYQYQKIQSKEYKTLARATNYIFGFIAACLCLLMLFGREIVLIFGGHKYIDSISLIIPICLGVFFNYMFQIFARVQEYFESKKTIVFASVCCAVLNIVTNYIFINIFGYQAAAYTTFGCYALFCFIHYKFYKSVCMKNIGGTIYDAKGILLISIGIVAMAVIIAFLNKFLFVKWIVLGVTIVLVIAFRDKLKGFINMLRAKE